MDSLANYGSDDEYEESPRHRKSASAGYGCASRAPPNPHADNYDEVQMDLSEDSNDSPKSEERRRRDRSSSRDRPRQREYDRSKEKPRKREERNRDSPNQRSNGRDEEKARREEDACKRNDEDRYRSRDRDGRDRYREDKYKDRYSREKYTDRKRRSSSRDRKVDYRKRSRSRSGSRERSKPGYSRRYNNRASSKMAHLEKLGIEIKPNPNHYGNNEPSRSFDEKNVTDKDRFFMPGITGRFKDQIERRKLLWQKKEPEKIETAVAPAPSLAGTSSRAGKVWEATTFAQDSDGKVANKFKRLMGIKEQNDEVKPPSDILKKQEEMFSSMEAQYEVARTATHTMRGVGLGFGSFQR